MALISGRMTCSSFYVTAFPNEPLLEAGRLTLGKTYTYIMKSRLAILFGEVTDREMKHPGEEASGHLGALGKEESRIRGARALLGRLALGPGPIGALGLGRLAKRTEPGPMVPTMPPFFVPVRVIVPGQKKMTSLTVISWGTVDHQ